MKSRIVGLLGALIVFCCAMPVEVANAVNINLPTTGCMSTFTGQDDVVHGYNGSFVYYRIDNDRYVVCAVPRSPLAAGATSGAFYVDGNNYNGATTSCTIYSYSYTGDFLGSASFSSSDAIYDRYVSLPSTQLDNWAYVSLVCVLPRNANGSLRGVTALQ